MKENIDRYADIIAMPHHRSVDRQPLSAQSRAAQFAPFSALAGLEDSLEKTACRNVSLYETDISSSESDADTTLSFNANGFI